MIDTYNTKEESDGDMVLDLIQKHTGVARVDRMVRPPKKKINLPFEVLNRKKGNGSHRFDTVERQSNERKRNYRRRVETTQLKRK